MQRKEVINVGKGRSESDPVLTQKGSVLFNVVSVPKSAPSSINSVLLQMAVFGSME